MNRINEKPRSWGYNSQGREMNGNTKYNTSDTFLSTVDVERMFGCSSDELCPDMLARLPEMLVIPEWESW